MDTIKQLAKEWQADEISRRSAAIAFYTFLSLAPLLIILVSILGFVYGKSGAEANLMHQAQTSVGDTAASALKTILDHAGNRRSGIIGVIVGWVLLTIGASGILSELQSDLNVVWKVQKKPKRGIWGTIINRLLTFLGLLVVGLLLLISLLAGALVSGFAHRLDGVLPAPGIILQVVQFLVFFGIIVLLIAYLFKVLPNTPIRWKDVWLGATITAFMFSVGKLAIGLYLGLSSTSSSFGAAGAFVVLLIWVYYSAQILLTGAVLTQIYAGRHQPRESEPAASVLPLTQTPPRP